LGKLSIIDGFLSIINSPTLLDNCGQDDGSPPSHVKPGRTLCRALSKLVA
jgi:hypothetical protein